MRDSLFHWLWKQRSVFLLFIPNFRDFLNLWLSSVHQACVCVRPHHRYGLVSCHSRLLLVSPSACLPGAGILCTQSSNCSLLCGAAATQLWYSAITTCVPVLPVGTRRSGTKPECHATEQGCSESQEHIMLLMHHMQKLVQIRGLGIGHGGATQIYHLPKGPMQSQTFTFWLRCPSPCTQHKPSLWPPSASYLPTARLSGYWWGMCSSAVSAGAQRIPVDLESVFCLLKSPFLHNFQ